MREIRFRGKRLDNGEWVDGGYYEGNAGGCYILQGFQSLAVNFGENDDIRNEVPALFRVDPNTVSQYTGLKDKNGQKIFEGDIVLKRTYNGKRAFPVDFTDGMFYAGYGGGSSTATHGYTLNDRQIEIIGNKWDNPELLH